MSFFQKGGQQEEIIVETVNEEDHDNDEPPAVTNTADHDELEEPDVKTQEHAKKEPDMNTNPELAKKIFFRSAMEDAIKHGRTLPTIDVGHILGRTFITRTPNENGEQSRARIEGAEFMQQRTADGAEPLIKFKCRVGDEKFEQILTYNRMLQWCEQDKDKDEFFRLIVINRHRKNKNAKGGWQVNVRWASGCSIVYFPVDFQIDSVPIFVSFYSLLSNTTLPWFFRTLHSFPYHSVSFHIFL